MKSLPALRTLSTRDLLLSQMTRVGLSALVALTLATPAGAHEQLDTPSKDQLVSELRGINHQLRRARETLGDPTALDEGAATRALTEANIAFLEEDYPRAAVKLLKLVSRPRIRGHVAYPDALALLGESLWHLGLRESALRHLRDALAHSRQTPSTYRRVFARYLTLAGRVEELSEVRRFWRTYQAMRGGGPLEPEDRDVRYQYAKALFHGGALSEAEALFAVVDEDDPHHLKAHYFLGVVRLSRDDLVSAQAAFEGALESYRRQDRKSTAEVEAREEYLEDVAPDGPAVERVHVVLSEDEILPDEEVVAHRRMGAVIHLALARLAAYREDDRRAWNHYRQVPPGTDDFAAALSEATFVVYRLANQLDGEVDIDTDGDGYPDASDRQLALRWCARLIDQLLAGRGDDISGARLDLWKAQLLAKATDYEHARKTYAQIEAALGRRSEQLEAQIGADQRLFPQAVLAWTTPDEAHRARLLEAELVVQQEELTETREILAELRAAARSSELLPAVVSARELKDTLLTRLKKFEERLLAAETAANAHASGDGEGLHSGGPPANLDDVRQLRQSGRRMMSRLVTFSAGLDTYERNFRARIRQVLADEAPAVSRLSAEMDGTFASTQLLAKALRTAARTNLENAVAEARFGVVDIAFWRKEAVSRRITDALQKQKALQDQTKQEDPGPDHEPLPPTPITPPAPDGGEDDGGESASAEVARAELDGAPL